MTDEFEFTLRSPLTQEDWNKISDAELENTMSITFQTPQGIQVKYIKCEVLDKVRTEIKQMPTISFNANDIYKADVLAILDKYMAESEVSNANSN